MLCDQPVKLTMFVLACVMGIALSDVSITRKNYDELTKGKTVFIKFFAPWCGHCKEIAPKWEGMAKEWSNHTQGLVASVDCTVEEEWCVSLGIEGFPTLLYGDPSRGGIFLETYSGDKEYDDLSKFANNTLITPICSPDAPDVCDKATKKKIKKMWKLSSGDLKKEIAHRQQMIVQAEKDFEQAFQKMQEQYDQSSQVHELSMANIRTSIKILQDILDKKNKS